MDNPEVNILKIFQVIDKELSDARINMNDKLFLAKCQLEANVAITIASITAEKKE